MKVTKEILVGLAERLATEPMTAADIATMLGTDTPTARRWLKMLADVGYSVTTASLRYGRGRPGRVFTAEKAE